MHWFIFIILVSVQQNSLYHTSLCPFTLFFYSGATYSKVRTQPLLTANPRHYKPHNHGTQWRMLHFVNSMHSHLLRSFSVCISDVFTQNSPVWVSPSVSTAVRFKGSWPAWDPLPGATVMGLLQGPPLVPPSAKRLTVLSNFHLLKWKFLKDANWD